MKIGSEILIKAKVIDLDSNPHGSSIKVEVKGFGPLHSSVAPNSKEQFWIHRVDIPEVVVAEIPQLQKPEAQESCNYMCCTLSVDVIPGCGFAEFESTFEGKRFVGRDRCRRRKELPKLADTLERVATRHG